MERDFLMTSKIDKFSWLYTMCTYNRYIVLQNLLLFTIIYYNLFKREKEH